MAYEFIGQAAVNTANAFAQHIITNQNQPIDGTFIKNIFEQEIINLGYSPASAKGSLTVFKALAEAGYIKGVPSGAYLNNTIKPQPVYPCNKDRAIALRDQIVLNGYAWPTFSDTKNQYDDPDLWDNISKQLGLKEVDSDGCVAVIRGLFNAGILI